MASSSDDSVTIKIEEEIPSDQEDHRDDQAEREKMKLS